MAGIGAERPWVSRLIGMVVVIAFLVMISVYALEKENSDQKVTEVDEPHYVMRLSNSKGQHGPVGHYHVWPVSHSNSDFSYICWFIRFFKCFLLDCFTLLI